MWIARRGPTLVVLLLAASAACGSRASSQAQDDRESAKMAKQAVLSARFAVTADKFRVHYTVTNTSAVRVFVIDVVVRVDANGASVHAGPPRVELGTRGELALVAKLREFNPLRSYAAPPQAYASMIEPGGARTETMEIDLPLVPGNMPPAKAVHEVVYERVSFTVGIVPAPAAKAAVEQEIGGVKVWRLPMDAYKSQEELRVAADVAGIRVLVAK